MTPGDNERMIEPPSPEADTGPDTEEISGVGPLSYEQLTVESFLDELANAMGLWGPESNMPVKPKRRRRA